MSEPLATSTSLASSTSLATSQGDFPGVIHEIAFTKVALTELQGAIVRWSRSRKVAVRSALKKNLAGPPSAATAWSTILDRTDTRLAVPG